MSRAPCLSKQALLRGLRPNSSTGQKILCGVCPQRCIFCDIWKLASLITSHVPISHRISSSTSSKLQRRMSNSSSSSADSFDLERSERAIEAQFQTQRSRLASIMSICTVDGADECGGLRLARDRCLGSVQELMLREQTLIERATAAAASSYSRSQSQQQPRRTSRDCGSDSSYYGDHRRPSLIGLAR